MTYDKKKWVLLSVTIAAFLVVIWQIRAMMTSDFVPSKKPPVAVEAARPVHHATPSVRRPSARVASVETRSQQTPLYVQLAKEIELAKMRRQLVEQQVAIAQAEQRLAALRSSSSSMSSLGQLSSSSVAPHQSEYKLLAISDQGNEGWNALMSVNGRMESLHLGQELENGDEVIHMAHDQVWIDQHEQAIAVSFKGVQHLSMRAVSMARKRLQASRVPATVLPKHKVKTVVAAKPSITAAFGKQEAVKATRVIVLPKATPAPSQKPSAKVMAKKTLPKQVSKKVEHHSTEALTDVVPGMPSELLSVSDRKKA